MCSYLIAILGVLIAVFFWRAAKGAVRSMDSLSGPLSDLLKRGYNCGFLIIKIGYSNKRFLLLRKYINGPGNYGIQLAFPKAKWSLPYFDSVRSVCIGRHPTSCVVDDGVLDFLYVDFGKDVSEATECIKEILREVFGVTESTKLFVKLENATVEDKLIDAPLV